MEGDAMSELNPYLPANHQRIDDIDYNAAEEDIFENLLEAGHSAEEAERIMEDLNIW